MARLFISTISMIRNSLDNLKVALVAEELTQLGGAERVLDCLIELFPKAPVYTLVWDNQKTGGKYAKHDIRTSFIQKLPFGIKNYKWYLPLMPWAIESFDFKKYDVVLSVTSALVKGVKTKKPTVHICYCNTPTRWLWFDSPDYLKNAPIPNFIRPIMPIVIKFLRKWDLKASQRPDFYIANSVNVQKRIKKYYNRDSFPIFPPVDIKRFRPKDTPGQYYLIVSRIEPYKKVDLMIEAFKKLNLSLKIVGGGTRLDEYKNRLKENIELIGRVSDEDLAKYYQNANATIFPQEEDAGIVPLESMATGRPVIAYAKGGVLESIIDGKTGVLFQPQTVKGLMAAIKRFQKSMRLGKFKQQLIRQQAKKFDKKLFKRRILEYILNKVQSSNVKLQNKDEREKWN